MGKPGVRGGTDSADEPLRIVAVGAASSANKGAASMLQAVVDNLEDHLGPCRLDLLTTFPEEDAVAPPRTPEGMALRIIPFRPWQLVLPSLPLALLTDLARRLGVRGRAFCLTPALRSLSEADVVLDLAGISFSDRRGFPTLVYNILMTGVPVLVAGRVIKCSQAIGPFQERLNRMAARAILSRLTAVIGRGEETVGHLRGLGLPNVEAGADLAFLMRVPDRARTEADRLIEETMGAGPFVAVVPSTVLEARCRRNGIDYPDFLAAFLRRLSQDGERLLLVPHAARVGRRAGRMNDLPLIRAVRERVASEGCRALDMSLPPEVLRAVIGRSDLLVTARFHGMISGLCEGVPLLVTGWGHKYGEALRDFGLEEWSVDVRSTDPEGLHRRFQELMARAPAVRSRIESGLPAVRARARRNFDILREVLDQEAVPS